MKECKSDEENPLVPCIPSAPPEEIAQRNLNTTPLVIYNQAYPFVEIRRVELTDLRSKFENNLRKHYPQKSIVFISLLISLINLTLLVVEIGFTPDWNLLKSYVSNNDDENKCDQFVCQLFTKFILFWLRLLFLFLVDAHIYIFGFYKALISCVNMVFAILSLMTGMFLNLH
jgi:hypothetical protein